MRDRAKLLYNMLMTETRVRLTMEQKLRALAYIARGDTVSQVVAHLLEDYDLTISEAAIYRIKRDHRDDIAKLQDRLADSVAADTEQLIRAGRVQIAKKLQKADRDGSELEVLDQQYRDGEIDKATYQRKKTGLLNLSVNQLSDLTTKLTNQQMLARRGGAAVPETPELPDGAATRATIPGGSTPAQLEAMLAAIKDGNTVELQRIVFTPGVKQ